MIQIQPGNSLSVKISGLDDEGEIVLDGEQNTLSLRLVPFMKGENAKWATLTQLEYDALPAIDPDTLYLII